KLVSRLFDFYGQRFGKQLVGDKTPDYVRHMESLHRLWPTARFVHVIRDGRDVVTSMQEWPKVHPRPGDFVTWEQDQVSTAAWWWEQNVHLGCQAGLALGPGLYYEVRYESLVTRPRETFERLAEFLAVPFDESVLHFHQRRGSDDPGLEVKR